MISKILTSSIVTVAVVLWLGSTPSMAQEAPQPGYVPQPSYAPQPEPAQSYPPQAYAAPPMAGYHEHDGLYLRLLLGVGYLHGSARYLGSSESVHGVGGTFGLAVGGSVNPSLVIYGELLGTSVSDPTVEANGTSGTASGVTATMAGIGPGVAYYLDDNLYLSGTLLFSKLSFSDTNSNDQYASTNWGIGAGLTVGKEWWISHDWGLGVSGQFQAASMKDNGVDSRWTTISASLLFSATCN